MIYIIDLDCRRPAVLEFSGRELVDDMEYFQVKNAMDLASTTYDRKFFRTEREAEEWLKKYEATLKSLDNAKICKSRRLPAILYKRRYIVLTLLGEKMQTYRSYLKKDWKPGDLINLHDQTFFLTVRLTSIEKTDKGFCYKFELP